MSNCEEIKPRLAAFLDGEVEDSDSIQAHIDGCPECRNMLSSYKKVSRLVSLAPDPPAGQDAWERLAPKLTTFPGARILAFAPAAIAAGIALVLYLFFFPYEEGREAIASLVQKTGSVRIKSSESDDWTQPLELHSIYSGDSLKTGLDGAARLQLVSGGYLILDCDSEICIPIQKTAAVRFTLISGRTFARGTGRVCFEAAGAELEGCGCCCVISIRDGVPIVCVKSGSLNCRIRDAVTTIRAMQKLILDESGIEKPEDIKDSEMFQWAEDLFKPASR